MYDTLRKPSQVDADVVVVGYGAAGASAAIAAHDAGANTVILEKQETQIPITNSFMAGGIYICPSDRNLAVKYLEGLYNVGDGIYWTDPDIIRVWAEYTSQNKKWLDGLSAPSELYRRSGQHNLPGTESIDVYRINGMGPGMMRYLNTQVEQRKIPLLLGMRVNHILVNSKGETTGVTALGPDNKQITVRARRAVILATGGFEFDEQAKLQFLKIYPFYFDATPWDTGDGVRMATEIGAQLWHMNCCAGDYVMKFRDMPYAMRPELGGTHWLSPAVSALPNFGGEGFMARHASNTVPAGGYVLIDRHGKRFTNENTKTHVFSYELALFNSRQLFYPRIPIYWIFDRKRFDDGPLAMRKGGTAGPAQLYKWSQDNSAELEKGWIKQAKTVRELGAKIQVQPDVLEETFNSYNRYCEKALDLDFNRESQTLIPLSSPPYYAVELWPGGVNTQGGPRRNARSQVLRPDGSPIPRLFSNGELGSVYGMLYPGGGGNLAECFAFGRIAGENAASYPPR